MTPAALNSGGTAPLLVAADESAVLVAGVRYDALAAQLLARGVPPFVLIVAEAVLSPPLVFAAFFALPASAAESVLAPAVAGVFDLVLIVAEAALAPAIAFAVFFALPVLLVERALAAARLFAFPLIVV